VISRIESLDPRASVDSHSKRTITLSNEGIPRYESSTNEQPEGECLAAELSVAVEMLSYSEPNIASPALADPPGYSTPRSNELGFS